MPLYKSCLSRTSPPLIGASIPCSCAPSPVPPQPIFRNIWCPLFDSSISCTSGRTNGLLQKNNRMKHRKLFTSEHNLHEARRRWRSVPALHSFLSIVPRRRRSRSTFTPRIGPSALILSPTAASSSPAFRRTSRSRPSVTTRRGLAPVRRGTFALVTPLRRRRTLCLRHYYRARALRLLPQPGLYLFFFQFPSIVFRFIIFV